MLKSSGQILLTTPVLMYIKLLTSGLNSLGGAHVSQHALALLETRLTIFSRNKIAHTRTLQSEPIPWRSLAYSVQLLVLTSSWSKTLSSKGLLNASTLTGVHSQPIRKHAQLVFERHQALKKHVFDRRVLEALDVTFFKYLKAVVR